VEWAKAIGELNERSNGIETDHEGTITWVGVIPIFLNLRCMA
jgi:hypothetical protein